MIISMRKEWCLFLLSFFILSIHTAPRSGTFPLYIVPIKADLTVTGDLLVSGNITLEGSLLIKDTNGFITSYVPMDANGNAVTNGISKNGIITSWPSTAGPLGTVLTSDGLGGLVWGTGGGGGSGNVSTALFFNVNNRIITTDTTVSPTNVQQSGVTIDTSNNISGVNILSANTVNANVNGNLFGNATSATNATTAGSATNFTGSLTGDVTGTQSATVVNTVGGLSAASVATGATAANNATNNNTPSTIVKRDASGNFSAGIITANLNGNATTATSSGSFTGSLSGDVTGTQSATVVNTVGGLSAASVATGATAANNATNNNTPSTIVKRDASGNFSAGVITANLNGNATTATSATTADSATNFTGSLSGDVIGTQSATVVNTVGGLSAVSVATGATAANNATNNNTPSTIVKRDASGNFSAGVITANLNGNATTATSATTATTAGSATNFTGSLSGDVTGTQAATVVSTVAGVSAATIASGANAANAATPSNTVSTIVKRDSFGNFITNMITLAGTVSNPTDAATKSYVDNAVSTGFTVHTPAIVISTANIASLSGGMTIDGVSVITDDRVLLNGQTNQVENGLWVVKSGAWIRPTDFQTGTVTGSAYVLVTSGNVGAGSSWVCNTPMAVIDTDPITFALFAVPDQTTGANVGVGAGQVFKDKTGNTINFRTLLAAAHILLSTITNEVTVSTDGTPNNTVNTLVARDASGNFSAGTITANLNGNATTATSSGSFSGSLSGDVTGTQSATVVGTVGGVTAANVASGATAANNATSANTASAIVARDGSGNFSAGTISASVTAPAGTAAAPSINFAGASTTTGFSCATANTLVTSISGAAKTTLNSTGLTLNSGILTVPAGTAAAPTVNFTSSPGTGLSCATVNQLSLDTNGAERMNISATGTVTINGFGTAGVIHNSAAGALSTSLIVNADVSASAAIVDTKLATISTAGKVSNSATTATSANTANAIVARDGSGNFSAGTISANLTASAGTAAAPSINFTGVSTGTGLSCATANQLSLDTNGAERMNISATGTVTINGLSTAGVVHNSAAGALSTSLIVNADVDPAAAIVDTKLATISTAGKVSNSATTATSANTANAIVARDGSGNFSAGTISASVTAPAGTAAAPSINFTGASTTTGFSCATANTLVTSISGAAKTTLNSTGLTLNSGILTVPAGTAAAPTVNFTSSTTTGLSCATVNQLSLDTNGAERMNISATGTVTINGLSTAGVVHNSAAGALSTSLIVNADVDPAAAIVDTKLATISTANKVANSATTATSTNTASAIVARDGSGNFSAGTISASVTAPAGTAAAPSINFTGSTTTGFSCATVNQLSFDTAGVERMNISPTGTVTINGLSTAGVVHNSAAGALSTSLIVNADVDPAAAIVDTKLATISTAGKVSNSATTATSANTANAIVARDASGNFSAGTVSVSTLNTSQQIIFSGGSTSLLGIQMAGQNSGFYTAGGTTFGWKVNGNVKLFTDGGTMFVYGAPLYLTGTGADIRAVLVAGPASLELSQTKATVNVPFKMQSLEILPGNGEGGYMNVNITNGGTITTTSSTRILVINNNTGGVANCTVVFPGSPSDGQLFTILCTSTQYYIGVSNNGNGKNIYTSAVSGIVGVVQFTPAATVVDYGQPYSLNSVTYYFNGVNNTWYPIYRG